MIGMKKIHIALIGLMAVALVAGLVVTFSGKASGGIPAYATRHPLVKEAYMFAVENPGALDGVNCYCGCMHHPHDGRVHSRGLLDCYRTADGGFDRHASECDMCIMDALQVKEMTAQGKTKDEIKRYIDGKYT
ncbi:MAG: hypothetical protein HY368_03245 [Candidatus Aenigmarchaeota archaeon]|nr:hypothetical protein [Candidatus Aenigmarchaeota archaeon]